DDDERAVHERRIGPHEHEQLTDHHPHHHDAEDAAREDHPRLRRHRHGDENRIHREHRVGQFHLHDRRPECGQPEPWRRGLDRAALVRVAAPEEMREREVQQVSGADDFHERELDQADREQDGDRAEREGAQHSVAQRLTLPLLRQPEHQDGEHESVIRTEQALEQNEQPDREEVGELDVHAPAELLYQDGIARLMEFKDYYKTLGVSKTATEKEIKQAYRKLARKHHPDVNPGDKSAESKFKAINEAYEVLGDPAKRKKYDELGANWRMYEQGGAGAPGGGPPPGWNVNYGARPGSSGGGGFRTMTEEEMREMFGDSDPFSDFFHTFFGGGIGGDQEPGARGRGARARAPRQGRDVEQEIELNLEDALHGTTRRFSISHDGSARNVDVRIPAGVGDGSRVRIAGEGEHGTSGAKSGDLYLRVRLVPHPKFDVKGKDLYARVTVPLTTAVLGGEAQVETLGGKSLRLKIPSGTQNGQVFRLKGHGMPTVNHPDQTGDLYATPTVHLPTHLTPTHRLHVEHL